MTPRPLTPAGRGDVWLRLEARAGEVGVVRQALAGMASALCAGDAALGDIAVAVGEACANVVEHAYPAGGPLEVEAWVSGPRLVVVVRDRGRGLAPRPSSGLSLGLTLMAALSDEVGFASGEPGVNEVWMAFRLPARDGAVVAS